MTAPSGMWGRAPALAGGLLLLAAAGWARPAAGQETVEELAAQCGGQSPDLRSWCEEVALALQAAHGGVGFLEAGGNELPGAASTLGWRLEGVPRVTVAGRFQVGRLSLPDILEGARRPAAERTSTVPSGHLTAGVGVFDGFSPAPTVGGLFSVDVLGTASLTLLPESEGFGSDAGSLGIGARVGLLRESFTLPGITVSTVHRWTGEVGLGSVDAGDPGEAAFDLSTTSIRATAGKDLLGVGVLAGLGWDRYASDATIRARIPAPGGGPALEGTATEEDFVTSRMLVYGGASLSLLIVQISAEAGWATGYEPIPGRPAGGYDPEASTPFGSLTLRLIF